VQLTLYAPAVTCEHCIATIEQAVGTVDGATFLHGDSDVKSFVVEVTSGAVVDQIAAATSFEGYPLGDATSSKGDSASAAAPNWVPIYTVIATDKGADLNYSCPCGCTAGFALDRSDADQQAEGCCCGRELLVAPANAEERLKAGVNGGDYRFDVQTVELPWGQPMLAAIAIPVEA
jgi:copper chaperone CopZ